MLIDLSNVSRVKDFVKVSQDCKEEILIKSGKYIVDGKSILGIFSLDLSKPVELELDESIKPRFAEFEAK